jgi:glycosyltransferase involved in cell wall biosynthesis
VAESTASRKRLFVAGCGLRGDGYPNAWLTLQRLREYLGVEIVECGKWLPDDYQLWKVARSSRLRAIWALARIVAANVSSAARLLVAAGRGDIAYVPYPAMFLLWVLSWVPRRWRPACVCDAYITVWDTVFQDRALGATHGLAARAFLWFERRALRTAEHVIVDTVENAKHVAALFDVDPARISSFPLAIDERAFQADQRPRKSPGPVRVLFTGTFVPLQGATVLAEAIHLLRNDERLEFVVIGDGQEAGRAEPYLSQCPNVTWIREWQPASSLADHVRRADICLGVFGGEGKAARVLPFKLYIAMAAGKAIITQARHGLPESVPGPLPAIPVVPKPVEIAKAIAALASDAQRRDQLARSAHNVFKQHLNGPELARRWHRLFRKLEQNSAK